MGEGRCGAEELMLGLELEEGLDVDVVAAV